MERKIIAVDVDLTVVDSLSSWVEWYHTLTGHNIEEDLKTKTYGIEELMHRHSTPMDFWRKPDLYDNLQPIEDCVDVLTYLSGEYDIIFVSKCEPEHQRSKEYFIKRNFPFSKGFISTGDKEFIKADIFIDDYEKFLTKIKNQNEFIKVYMHKTRLNENHQQNFKAMDWNEILQDIDWRKH
jgi:5'(3')-deoxyribonucleotidase